ncbi:MAG: hypothetical protein NT166_25205 [Candidatus Aminicenantes bacterium]|nr:hypothetical protein [Candidatus Aminicenantes bacterium]
MLKTNSFSEAQSCLSLIGRRWSQTPGKKFRKPPLDFLLETPLYRNHYRLSNTKKTLPIEHFKAPLRAPADGNDQTAVGRDQQTVGIEEKALRIDLQAVRIEEKALRTDQQAVGIEEKALRIDQQAVGIEKKALCTDQKAGGIYQEAGNNSLSAKLIFADKIKI